jgi:hypothetical protein
VKWDWKGRGRVGEGGEESRRGREGEGSRRGKGQEKPEG